VVLPNWASVERVRVDHVATAISSKELGKGGMEVIGDEGGDNIFFAIGDNKEMAGANGIKVVLPSGTREDTRLGTGWTGSAFFSLHVYGLSF